MLKEIKSAETLFSESFSPSSIEEEEVLGENVCEKSNGVAEKSSKSFSLKAFYFICDAAWVVVSSALILFAPVIIELGKTRFD
jgi:hypothetical protein